MKIKITTEIKLPQSVEEFNRLVSNFNEEMKDRFKIDKTFIDSRCSDKIIIYCEVEL